MSDLEDVRTRLIGTAQVNSISELYHENSKIIPSAPGITVSVDAQKVASDGFKRYDYCEQTPLIAAGGDGLLSVIANRRSCRIYALTPVSLLSLSIIIHHSFGISEGHWRRSTPSAGGLYPLELYIVATRVEALPAGLYHYNVRSNSLNHLHEGDFREKLSNALFIKEAVQTAAMTLLISGVFGRTKIKYRERAYRFALLEAGHAMQNICIAAAVEKLASCPIGGFIDDNLNDIVDVNGVNEAVLYAATIGFPL
jgi:SagB-type dehydrogenase family enzyme